MTGQRFRAAAVLLAAALVACDSEAPSTPPAGTTARPTGIVLSEASVQLPVIAGRPGVAYLTTTLAGGAPRTIVGAEVAGAGRAEMHASDSRQGVTRMTPLTRLAVAPGQTVKFAPGGYHIMLFDLDAKLTAGTTTQLTLRLDNGESATITAPVIAAGSAVAGAGKGMH